MLNVLNVNALVLRMTLMIEERTRYFSSNNMKDMNKLNPSMKLCYARESEKGSYKLVPKEKEAKKLAVKKVVEKVTDKNVTDKKKVTDKKVIDKKKVAAKKTTNKTVVKPAKKVDERWSQHKVSAIKSPAPSSMSSTGISSFGWSHNTYSLYCP